MKLLLTFFLIITTGCLSPSTQNSSEAKGEYVLHGVLKYGKQRQNLPICIKDAIVAAGGLRNCSECFKSGGEKWLWKTFAGAEVLRNGQTIKVKKQEIDTFLIQSGDEIDLLHWMIGP